MKYSLLTFVILTLGVSLLHADQAAADAAPAASTASPAQAQACSQLEALNTKEKSDLKVLNAQIKPLAEQRTALVEQNEQQRYALRNQIVPGSGDALKAFDDQKKAAQEAVQAQIRKITPPASPMSVCKKGRRPKLRKSAAPAQNQQ